jgi:hypothetical protein
VTTAVEVPERMASLTAIPRSKSERFGLGAHGLDTVAFRFRPGGPSSSTSSCATPLTEPLEAR